ncbi:SDR family oxidoreductase [Pseudoroseicyclus sp. H15]
MRLDLGRSTALVTGGARGIGLELTRQLVNRGAKVIAVGRNEVDLNALRAAYPNAVESRAADLSSVKEVDALVADLSATAPDINILINNAGVQFEIDLFGSKPDDATAMARREIAINLEAVVALTMGLLPIIARQEQGAIVNISSGLAIAPKAASPVYCATKAAVRSFTKSLRYQCAENAPHIAVSEAIMALVDTGMTRGRSSAKITAQQAAAEVVAALVRQKPEVWVAKAKLLRLVNRLSPRLAEMLMR